jgi:hypothetical protein
MTTFLSVKRQNDYYTIERFNRMGYNIWHFQSVSMTTYIYWDLVKLWNYQGGQTITLQQDIFKP